MKIPQAIRSIPRPKNTSLYATKDPDVYGVRSKIIKLSEEGKRIYTNGPLIGHIKHGIYVPLEEQIDPIPGLCQKGSSIKDWGLILALDKIFKPVLKELEEICSRKEARMLYCMALLLAAYPDMELDEFEEKYKSSVLIDLYPDTPLSSKPVLKLLTDPGCSREKIEAFLSKRFNHSPAGKDDVKVILNGSFPVYSSLIQILPACNTHPQALTFKASWKWQPDPAFEADFLKDLASKKGWIMAEKDCIDTVIKAYKEANPDLHYLYPIDLYPTDPVFNLYPIIPYFPQDYEPIEQAQQLPEADNIIYTKGKLLERGEYLYIYKSKNGEDLKGARDMAIAFASDLDTDPARLFHTCLENSKAETIRNLYRELFASKGFLACSRKFKEAFPGQAFIRLLAFDASLKLYEHLNQEGLLEKRSYEQSIQTLSKAAKVFVPPGIWLLVELSKEEEELLIRLGLLEKERPLTSRCKLGRPRKKQEKKEYKKVDFMESKTSKRIEKEQTLLREFLQQEKEKAKK